MVFAKEGFVDGKVRQDVGVVGDYLAAEEGDYAERWECLEVFRAFVYKVDIVSRRACCEIYWRY